MSRVPGSRLLLHAKPGSHRDRVRETFRAAGVDPDRIEFVPSRPFAEYLAPYNQIDLALDPFPYGGGTTTLDGLWMGVPIVTLAGKTAVGRGGVSIMTNLGLPEFIATTRAEYVNLAASMAGDIAKLDHLRQSMRSRLRQSPLTDAVRFTLNLEQLYRQMTG